MDEQLTGSDTKPYKDLSEEMQGYVSYIVNDLLMDKTGILSSTSIDKNDEMYKAWTKDETISLQEYLTYAARITSAAFSSLIIFLSQHTS